LKICLVSCSGGHLLQLYRLKSWWSKYDRFFVTFKKQDAISMLKGEKVYWAYFPTTRSIKNLVKNSFLALKILYKNRPDIIVSTGAGVAVPFFYVGKLLGSKLIFIESAGRTNSPSLTGRLVYPVSDKFLLQWKELKRFYPKGRFLEGLL
jgi:beta-1,4-N-acetylglucosaminyltransferase